MAIDFYLSGRRRSLEISGTLSITGSLVVRGLSSSGTDVFVLDEGAVYAEWGTTGGESAPYTTFPSSLGGAYITVASDFRTRLEDTDDGGTDWWITVGATVTIAGVSSFLASEPEEYLGRYPDTITPDTRFDWTVTGDISLLYNLEEFFPAPSGGTGGIPDVVYRERARTDSPGLFSVTIGGATASGTPPAWGENYDAQIGGWQQSQSNTVGFSGDPEAVPFNGGGGIAALTVAMARTGFSATQPPTYSWVCPEQTDGRGGTRSPGTVTEQSATVAAAVGGDDPDAEFPLQPQFDTMNFVGFRTRWRPADTIEAAPLIRTFEGDAPGGFKVELLENSATVLDSETTRTALSLPRGPYWQNRGEGAVGVYPSLSPKVYDAPTGAWPSTRGFPLPLSGRASTETAAVEGHFSHLFTKDTFTGAATGTLISHTGEIGASWSAVSGTSTAIRLDGTGGIYGNGSGTLRASGSGPGTAATITFDLDAKTTLDTFTRVMIGEGTDNYWRLNHDRGVGFEGWGLVYFVGGTAYGVATNSASSAFLTAGATNHLRMTVTDLGGGQTSCAVYLTNDNVTDLLILSGFGPVAVPGLHWASPVHVRVEIQAGAGTGTGTHLRKLVASVDSDTPSYDAPISMTGYASRFDAFTLAGASPKVLEASPFSVGGGSGWAGVNCSVSEVSGKLRIVVGALGAGVVAKAERALTRRHGYRYWDVKVRSMGSTGRAWSLITGAADSLGSIVYRLRYTGATGGDGEWVTQRIDLARLPAAPPTYPDETGEGNLGLFDRLQIGNLAANTTYEIESVQGVGVHELLFSREVGYNAITRDGALVKEPTGTTIANLITAINANPEQGFTATAIHPPRVDKPTSGYAPQSDYQDSSAPSIYVLGNGLLSDGISGIDQAASGPFPAQHLWSRITVYPWAGDIYEEGTSPTRGYGENTKFTVGILLRGAVYGVVVGGGGHVAGAALPAVTVELTRNDTGADAGDGPTRASGGYSTGAPFAPPGFDYKASLEDGTPPYYLILATGSGEHITRGRRAYRSFLVVPVVAGGAIVADISEAFRIVRASIADGNVYLEFATDALASGWTPVTTSLAADAVGVRWDRGGQAGRLWVVTVEGSDIKLRSTDDQGGTFSMATTIYSGGEEHPVIVSNRAGAFLHFARTSAGAIVQKIYDGFGHQLGSQITVVASGVEDDCFSALYHEAANAVLVFYRDSSGDAITVRSTNGGQTYS